MNYTQNFVYNNSDAFYQKEIKQKIVVAAEVMKESKALKSKENNEKRRASLEKFLRESLLLEEEDRNIVYNCISNSISCYCF